MMEDELRQLLKEQGWTLYKRTTPNGKEFYYALKWRQRQVYITAGTKLSQMTKDKVLEKLSAA